MKNILKTIKIGGYNILFFLVIMVQAQNKPIDYEVDGGVYSYASNDAQNPCITSAEYALLNREVSDNLKKIGLASDLTNVLEVTPIEEISMLVKDFKAELHILNTGKKAVFDADIVFETGLMQEMTMSLNPKFHFIDNSNIDEGIMDFAEKNQIDLLIVLPGKHNLLSSIFHRSHTKQMVLHSHIPVMSLHK